MFKTNKGIFKPTVMFFGMCNSPATFQAMMDDIFTGMIDGKLVIIYMDDILIFAETKEELERITKMVLAKLRDEEGQISMDPIKLAGIQNWPIPSTVKQVRSFLGFGNFYQKFISHYSDIAKPLNDLTQDQPIPGQPSLSAYRRSQNHSSICKLLYGLDH